MDYEQFLIKMAEAHNKIASVFYDYGPDQVEFWFIESLAEMTGEIDFQCNFNSSGVCWSHDTRVSPSTDPKCCCKNCVPTVGYLRQANQAHLKEYAALFDPDDGFWRAGEGCVLPRKMRSIICVRHNCLRIYDPEADIPLRTRVILRLLGRVSKVFIDYKNWLAVQNLPDQRSISWVSKYVDEWVQRITCLSTRKVDPIVNPFELGNRNTEAATWGEYYASKTYRKWRR